MYFNGVLLKNRIMQASRVLAYTNYRNCTDDGVDRSLDESQYSGT